MQRIFGARGQMVISSTRSLIASVLLVGACASPDVTSSEESSLTSRWTGTYNEVNVASSQNGAVASASSSDTGQSFVYINDGNRATPYRAITPNYGFWRAILHSKSSCHVGQDWVRINFNGVHTIGEIDLISQQDDYDHGFEPTAATVTTIHGNVSFHLSYCPQGITCGTTPTSGWVDVANVAGNNKAIFTQTFVPVRASAIRAQLDCTQGFAPTVVELEAWERGTPNTCPAAPPRSSGTPSQTGSASGQLVNDSDIFWGSDQGLRNMDQAQWRHEMRADFINARAAATEPGWWELGRVSLAAAQMYDVLHPINTPDAQCRANHYLELLRVMADEILTWRDDKMGMPADSFRNRVMSGWGFNPINRDYRWNNDISIAGLMAFPMAAFAKRVSANPSAFSVGYRKDAIRFTTAVMETYMSFRPEMHLVSSDPHAYHYDPPNYSTLACSYPSAAFSCSELRDDAGHAQGWNVELLFLRTMAEGAIAAMSDLYQTSSDVYKATTTTYLGGEAPVVIAKYLQYYVDYFNAHHLYQWAGDNVAYYKWNRGPESHASETQDDTPHGSIAVGALAMILEDKPRLDELLSSTGLSIQLSPDFMERHAVTFLRLIRKPTNLMGHNVYGTEDGTLLANDNEETAGFIALSPYDSWAWVRAHDALLLTPEKFREDNWAALLRYQYQGP